jgi:uncharacterized protein DUF6165
MRVYIPVSAGDLIDRITILRIKKASIPDAGKLANVETELDSLLAIRACFPKLLERDVKAKEKLLQKENRTLWAVEDKLRLLETGGDFGPAFVKAARSVYQTNDRRAALKREIDALVGSALREEKWFSGR